MSSKQRCLTHKYKRFSTLAKNKRHDIYYCVNCSSYKPMNMAIGTHTLCWKCGHEIVMDDSVPLKPMCVDCRPKLGHLTKETKPEINDLVSKLMDKL
jgi:hypothetical protein